jgi:hypothetical protein
MADPAEKKPIYPIAENPIYRDFQALRYMINALLENRDPPGLLVYSAPGLGKTFLVRQLYKEHFNHDVTPHGGSARGLMDYIFEHRDDVMVFDDFDRLFYDPELMALAKVLLDTNEPRIMVHRVRGENALPPFRVTAAVVIATNRDFDNPANFSRQFWATYVKPFRSRLSASIFKISDHTPDVYRYTLHLAPTILKETSVHLRKSGTSRKLTTAQQEDIHEHFRTNWHTYPEISPRMIFNMAKRRLNTPDDKVWHYVRDKFLADELKRKQQEEAEFEKLKQSTEKMEQMPEGSKFLTVGLPKRE